MDKKNLNDLNIGDFFYIEKENLKQLKAMNVEIVVSKIKGVEF